jgi:hypothetical protein
MDTDDNGFDRRIFGNGMTVLGLAIIRNDCIFDDVVGDRAK